MSSNFQINILVIVLSLFASCETQSKAQNSCLDTFNEVRTMMYSDSTTTSSLNKALNKLNALKKCDSLRIQIVDLKITLFVALKMYSNGVKYIDSLSVNDFAFGYKKTFTYDALTALDFNSQNNLSKQIETYRNMVNKLEKYIDNKPKIEDDEFKEVYTDLFSVKLQFESNGEINKEIDILQKKYPEKRQFFEFLKRH